MRAERDEFSVSCLIVNTSNNYFGTEICKSCNINCNVCSCNTPELALPPYANNEPEDSSEVCKTFPPGSFDLSTRQDIKPMDVSSKLEIVRNFEFNHEYINDQIDKFAITPILCNNCNDLSKHFFVPRLLHK